MRQGQDGSEQSEVRSKAARPRQSPRALGAREASEQDLVHAQSAGGEQRSVRQADNRQAGRGTGIRAGRPSKDRTCQTVRQDQGRKNPMSKRRRKHVRVQLSR